MLRPTEVHHQDEEFGIRQTIRMPGMHSGSVSSSLRMSKCTTASYCLAPSARSNPTAFKAVRFQPPDPYENGEHDGVQAQRARGIRPEVSHDLVHEVSVQDTSREGGRACARSDPADLPDQGRCHRSRGCLTGSYPPVTISSARAGAIEIGAIYQRTIEPVSASGIPRVAQKILEPKV